MIAPRIAAVLAALLGSGCCGILDLPSYRAEPDPDPNAPALELGTAVYPAGTPPGGATKQTWIAARLNPRIYRVGYALSPAERAEVDATYQVYARLVGYESQGNGRFRWRPPPGCAGDMGCVYENLAERSRADVAALAERFRRRAADAHLTSLDAAALVVTYVQSIKYEIPADEPFGVLPPALVASLRKGDCDSKSLLAHMILHDLGVDTVMIGSNAHKHEMLGIALPVQGTTFTHGGRRYAFTELTAKGSPIGHINPTLLRPDDWRPVTVRLSDVPKTAPAPAPKPSSKPSPKPSPKPRPRR